MKNFNGCLLADRYTGSWAFKSVISLSIIYLRSVTPGSIMCYPISHIQILDVSHDLLNGFVSGLPFSSPPLENLLSLSPLGRPDTQATPSVSLALGIPCDPLSPICPFTPSLPWGPCGPGTPGTPGIPFDPGIPGKPSIDR